MANAVDEGRAIQRRSVYLKSWSTGRLLDVNSNPKGSAREVKKSAEVCFRHGPLDGVWRLCNPELLCVIQAGMAGANLLVFRETAETVSGRELARRLLSAIPKTGSDTQANLSALLLAGEVECALSDCGWASAAKAQEITDILAALFLQEAGDLAKLQSLAAEVANDLPETVRISHPEGFAYYALHPGDFADAVAKMVSCRLVGVVGIRSVGTTLSAVVAGTLRRIGVRASRITVRPVGHAYDRKTELEGAQRAWLREQQRQQAMFLIVDEGPGLSGSSFLSTAESLMREEIGAERITLLGTRDVDPGQLCASDAGARWGRFEWRRVASRISERFKNATSLCGGAWRQFFLPVRIDGCEIPCLSRTERGRDAAPVWPEMDGVKYWSRDRTRVFKFEGLGEIGTEIRERSRVISEAGFGPGVEDARDGMSSYEFVPGKALAVPDLSTAVLDRMAEYCAFRAAALRSDHTLDGQLEEMVRFNYSQETGRECPVSPEIFRSVCAVIADARMSPHEWIARADGRLVKVDGARDGDDHFFPGPVDITWDLAGAIVEWELDRGAQEYLLRRFQEKSGIKPENVSAYLLAYSIFRASYCKMAWMGTGVESEKPGLHRAYGFYRRNVDAAVRRLEEVAAV